MNRFWARLHWIGAGLVFFVTQIVYLRTMTITCPFWDSGEFIATSYILGIPHPPGTPLYVLIGRLFSILPLLPTVAQRVNWLSALASSLTAVFLYLLTVELWRRWFVSPRETAAEDERAHPVRLAGFFAGLTAAFFCAFGTTFWDNAIEAEVYSLAALTMALSAWLILRWSRVEADPRGKAGLFLLMYYLICLSMGFALSAFLILPGIVLFALLEDPKFFAHGRTAAMVVAGLTILLHPGMLPTAVWFYVAAVALVLLGVLFMRKQWPAVSGHGLLTWCLIVSVLALSTHFYLTIRALYHNPSINEADPQTWSALWKVLTRDQYKPPNPFLVRKAPWGIQFTRHFWDYARDQYSLGLRPVWLGWYIPYLLGLVGIFAQFRRDRRGFALLGSSYLIMTIGLVFYLNFAADEVRPRDYFFAGAFQFYPVWIGLGAGFGVLALARLQESARAGLRMLALAGVVAVLLPFMTARYYWYEHDRHRFWIARDFAWNMLTPLKPNAILFTNGDNDTFPLWYLQEVEHIRKDVRVANLSLLNTHWYIRQLRDTAPTIDVGWNDAEINQLEAYLDPRTNQPVYIKDMAVHRIVQREYRKRPIYVAVTVPELMGLDDRLVMEGLAFELEDPVPGQSERVDADLCLKNLFDVYSYRGILDRNGRYDTSVYKDENATHLTQNYAAGFLRAAEEKIDQGDVETALKAADRAKEISPYSRVIRYSVGILIMRAQRYAEAEQYFLDLVRGGDEDPRVFLMLGRAQEAQQKMAEAEASYRRAVEADPSNLDALRDLFSFLWETAAKKEDAVAVLRDWARRNPNDPRVGAALQEYEDSLSVVRSGAKR